MISFDIYFDWQTRLLVFEREKYVTYFMSPWLYEHVSKSCLTYKNELLDWSLKIFGSHYFVLNISLSSNLCIVFCQFKKKLIFFHFLDIFSLFLL